MKKLIKILSVFSLTAIPTFSIVSCSSNLKDEDTKVIHLNLVKSIFNTGILVTSEQTKEKTCDKDNFEKFAINMLNKQYPPTSTDKKPNIEITSTDVKFNYFSTEKGDKTISTWNPVDINDIKKSNKLSDLNADSEVFCQISSNSTKTDGKTGIFLVQVYRYDSEK